MYRYWYGTVRTRTAQSAQYGTGRNPATIISKTEVDTHLQNAYVMEWKLLSTHARSLSFIDLTHLQ